MARYSEGDLGFTFFEDRLDLPSMFEPGMPDSLKAGFDLPQDVDFVVHLGRHATKEDFFRTDELITPDTDMLFGEGSGNQWLEFYFDEIRAGSVVAYKKCHEMIKQYCPPGFMGHQLALLESMCEKRTLYRILDPPKEHPSYKLMKKCWDTEGTRPQDEENEQLLKIANIRDIWVLHNLKKLVDTSVPYSKGKRRQIVISRGTHHINLLRALEFQTEYRPHKANGSVIVSSTVDMVFSDGSGMLTDFIESMEKQTKF